MIGGQRSPGWPLTGLFAIPIIGAGVIGADSSLAHAQKQVRSEFVLEGRPLFITPREMAVLSKLRNTLPGRMPRVQDAALAVARQVVTGRDARHVLALYQLEIGTQRENEPMRAEALDILLNSDFTSLGKRAEYLAARGQIAYQLGDFAAAKAFWTELLEQTPNDGKILANLAQVYQAENDPKNASDLFERAIAARTASHQLVPENWYRQWLSVANQGQLVRPGVAAAHALLTAYPNPANWRDALVVYRQLVTPEGDLEIDLLRLMRTVGALARPAEFQRMAQLLIRSGDAVEARAVLDDGISRAILNADQSPTREILGEANRAIALGSAKSSGEPTINAAESNTHLGMALFAAGKRTEAAAAFRLAAASPRTDKANYADLATFWLNRMAQEQTLLTPSPPLPAPGAAGGP